MPEAARPTRPWRILVVEDDPVARDHFIEIISDAADFDLAGIAGSLAQAKRLGGLEPDLFFLDMGLPDGSGLDLIPEIKAGSSAKVLVITSFGDRDTVVGALRAGADGYLLKDSSPEVIEEGMRVTMEGGTPISSAAAVYLLDQLRTQMPEETRADDTPPSRLTPREVEVLEQFAQGSSYKETARALDISALTVGNHVKSIYRKLEVNSRGEAVYRAVKSGELKL